MNHQERSRDKAMLDKDKISEIIESVMSKVPEGVKDIPRDAKEHFKAKLSRSLEGLDMVSREEFDIQVKVLQKTRQKLEQIEKQLDALLRDRKDTQ